MLQYTSLMLPLCEPVYWYWLLPCCDRLIAGLRLGQAPGLPIDHPPKSRVRLCRLHARDEGRPHESIGIGERRGAEAGGPMGRLSRHYVGLERFEPVSWRCAILCCDVDIF